MNLQNFIDEKTEELKQSNLYNDVIFSRATEVKLKKYSTSENYITSDSNLDSEVEEVQSNQSNLGDEEQSGTKIVFNVLKKRKRNFTTISFYAIYK